MKYRFVSYLLLFLIVVGTCWSLFRPEMFHIHDFTHAARIAEMTRALQEGHFPVRWTQNFGYGWGMPLFEFYAPLPYYVGSLLYWLGFGLPTTIKLLFILCSLGTVVGGYKLGKYLFGELEGVIVAASLALAPYRAVNLFVRGALSEAWGIMVLPWILFEIIKVVDVKKYKPYWLLFWLVVLTLSHNLTTLMFFPISFIFAILYAFYNKKIKHFTKIVLAYSLSVGLTSFYLFPALLEKDYTVISSILSGYFYYSHHFLYIRQFLIPYWGYGGSAFGPDDGLSFFLGYGQLIALIILAVTYLFHLKSLKRLSLDKMLTKQNFLLATSVLFLVTSLLLTTFKSAFLWELIPVLPFIQFPWRWIAPAILFLSLLNGLAITFIKNEIVKKIIFLVLFIILLGNSFYFRPEKYLDNAEVLYYGDQDKIQSKMSDTLPDYIPSQVDIGTLSKMVSKQKLEDYANLEVLVNRGHQKLVRTNFSQPQQVEFPIADFPGWYVEIDGVRNDSAKSLGELGNIIVTVPQGPHLVGVIFGYTQVRLISDLISLASLFVIIWLTVRTKNR